jgi:hypothetical protein
VFGSGRVAPSTTKYNTCTPLLQTDQHQPINQIHSMALGVGLFISAPIGGALADRAGKCMHRRARPVCRVASAQNFQANPTMPKHRDNQITTQTRQPKPTTAGKRWNSSPCGRMLVGLPISLGIYPPAVLLFGWGMHFKLHLAVPLVGESFPPRLSQV